MRNTCGSMADMEDVEARRLAMMAKLDARHTARAEQIQADKEFAEQQANPEESVTDFEKDFRAQLQGLAASRDALTAEMGKLKLTARFDELTVQFAALRKSLNDAAHFLPAYDLRRCQLSINEFDESLQQRRAELIPKKRFAFKGKKSRAVPSTEADVSSSASAEPLSSAKADAAAPVAASPNSRIFADQTDQTIELGSELNGKDVSLHNLKNCTVIIKAALGSGHVSRLDNCKILSGPVSRSWLIDGCVNTTFVAACQQARQRAVARSLSLSMRIHNAYDTAFYIHVSSRAIIEDCDRLGFAPYNWTYERLDEDFEASGLPRDTNNWDKVNDFKWLDATQPSPHWHCIPTENRQTFS
ncbi:uncharacterized protein MONBRDRAFT_30772 [Monosiga brevicollis MX1]|uniref:C-CAP/cofactor C-like domain-containing protein n=1 Tax=Monosiga brevicollis TaxID=81824 RepID=A9UP54_MONBE|nr:uncharacterized protein MONBRDRAFT_30772 [Monosiga brevicollis MX1]EDQ92361.1 predicted protein [Monosiga brevicollis MX1]|eukprot:XP_001742123.1 hypothetical protein [Monosiga brevicollis MX1]